jgi:hypothetical protein
MNARNRAARDEVDAQLRSFYEAWQRMDAEERRVVADIVTNTCPVGPPKNFHVHGDLLRRKTGFPMSKIEQILGNPSSLGFSAKIKKIKGVKLAEQRMVELVFDSLSASVEEPGPHNRLVQAIIEEIGQVMCPDCVGKYLVRGDFSQLSSSTMEYERHKRTLAAAAVG